MNKKQEGPLIKKLCYPCRHYDSRHFNVQGDTGAVMHCNHPARKEPYYLGAYGEPNTPECCPVLCEKPDLKTSDNPELNALLEKARKHPATEEELAVQRENYAKNFIAD